MQLHPIYYVIGDIHGEFDRLKQLHSDISDYHKTWFNRRRKIIIHLGDYVDRGLNSFEVVEWIMKKEQNSSINETIINLKGNHEEMMCKACKSFQSPDFLHWMKNGGRETLESYFKHGYDKPPKAHLDWMSALPTYFQDIDNKLICVHAGLNPNTFPNDGEIYHLWTRSDDFLDVEKWINPALEGMTVIHGHTVTENFSPEISINRQRINVDTGACYGGDLTSAVYKNGHVIDFLST